MAELVWWGSVALLLYVHAGYPALLGLWALARPRPWRVPPGPAPPPAVTVVVVARDEAARIAARVTDLLAQDYPADRLAILIASDGSRDDTAARARAAAAGDRRVAVVEYPRPRGKAATLMDALHLARGEVIAFADARQTWEPGALRALVTPLADPAVGAVGGELVLDAATGAAGADAAAAGLYWRYERWIRARESRVGSTVGVSGAIYAVRGEYLEPIPTDTLLDDVLIPLRVARRGRRVVFAPGARAHDPAAGAAQEFRRKVRTLAGNFQLLARERWVWSPRANPLWLQTLSHKVLRLAVPPLLALLLLSSVALAGASFWYLAALVGQLAFYAAALAAHRRPPAARSWPLRVAHAFCLLHAATVVGFWRWWTRAQPAAWKEPRAAADLPRAPRPDPDRRA